MRAKPIAKSVRLSDDDHALLEALVDDTGIRNASDVMRLALRSLAKERNVKPVSEPLPEAS
jgi:Arc/MetJ-type ribon-helix-helix transcriptional regulator